MDKTIKNIGKDKWGRTVYQGESGRLYCDTAMNDRFGRGSKFCTKANNEFDGEPDLPMPQDWNPQIIESKAIKVSEAQLRNMIAESVKRVINEEYVNPPQIDYEAVTCYKIAGLLGFLQQKEVSDALGLESAKLRGIAAELISPLRRSINELLPTVKERAKGRGLKHWTDLLPPEIRSQISR